MENIIQKAIAAAITAHQGETRKGDGQTPYVLHPIEVGIMVSYYTVHPIPVAAAILHDTVEHGKLEIEKIKENFGEEVAEIVALLTEDKTIKKWEERKVEAIKRLGENQLALVIKSIDALSNMRDLFRTVKAEGQAAWKRFNAPKEEKLAYFRLIFDQAKSHLPSPLIEQYISALKDLEYSEYLPGKEAEIGFQAK